MKKAFTLIELLVVIAIIAILAGLLLPALARAKDTALKAKCMSQQKQIGLAMHMYADDFRGYTVFPNWGTANAGWLYAPEFGAPPRPSDPPQNAYSGGLLWPYIKNPLVYQCPKDATNNPNWSKRRERLSTYVMNGAAMGYRPTPPAGQKTHLLSDFQPAAYAFWEPSDDPPNNPAGVYNDGANSPIQSDGPSKRHVRGCVVTGFDGRVEFYRFQTFLNQLQDGPGLLWCDPDSVKGNGAVGCSLR